MAASASGSGVGAKRKKATYKGSEEEFDFNCDVLDKLYAEVDLSRHGIGSNSFSSLSSTNTTGTTAATGAAAAASSATAAKQKEEKLARAAAAGGVDGKAKAPVPGEGSRFLASFRRIANESRLVLSVTDGDNVWSATLAYKEFCEHRAKLDLGDGVGWKELFGYMRAAFEQRSRLHIDLSTWAAPTLAVTYHLHETVDLLGRFTLKQIAESKSKLSETTNIMFALLERAKVNALAERTANELRSAKADLQTATNRIRTLNEDLTTLNAKYDELQANAASMAQLGAGHLHGGGVGITGTLADDLDGTGSGSAGGGASGGAAGAASQGGDAATAAAIVVKKKNMSVANPRLKRRKKRGVKIGEADD